MKKINFAIVLVFIFFASCQKNKTNLSPNESGTETNLYSTHSKNYKFSKEVRVYDATKKYYFDVEVKSNDEAAFTNNVNYFESSEMKLEYVLPQIENVSTNSNTKTNPNTQVTDSKSSSEDEGMVIVFKRSFKGEAKGFSIVKNENYSQGKSNQTYLLTSNNGKISIFLGPCSFYTVYPLKSFFGQPILFGQEIQGVQGDDYFVNNSGLSLIQSLYCPRNQITYFSGVGFIDRVFKANSFSPFLNYTLHIIVY